MSEQFPDRPMRRAAKAILTREDTDEIIFVAGKRGMMNLPGGGIDNTLIDGIMQYESPEAAARRELEEEIGLGNEQVPYLTEIGATWGDVTTASGKELLAKWSLFSGQLAVEPHTLVIPENSEITAIEWMTPRECLNHPNMSKLAVQSIVHLSMMSDDRRYKK